MTLRRELALAAALAALSLILALFAPRFFLPDHLLALIVRNASVLVAAVGMTIALSARQIDLSVGASASIAGVLAGLAAQQGWSVAIAGLVAVLGSSFYGLCNGLLVAKARMPAIVVTLATMAIGREGLRLAREGEFVRNLPRGFQWFGMSQWSGSMAVIAIAAVVWIGVAAALRWTSWGRAALMIGSNPEAARLAGIRTDRAALFVFAFLGALVGLSALLDCVRFSDVDPYAGQGLELKIIAACVVGGTAIAGGRASLTGTLLGVALLGTIGPALVFLGFRPEWEKAIQGGLILVAVAADALERRRA